jgi:hypothetical protein
MKNLLLFFTFFFLFTTKAISQNVIAFDYMETWNWPGLWWGNTFNSTWATNFSVSPNESAVIYGAGNGTSAIEQDWYVLPNITGLNPNSQYEFRFRLASYMVTSSASTRGVDVADLVEVQVSYNGGISYISELRITGNSNSFWNYNTNGVINHIADGIFNNNLAPIGDIYRSGTGNQQLSGPSVVSLQLPPGITQVAIDILCRVNSAGEEWWLDNIELVEFPNNPLPVTLTSFTAECDNGIPLLKWTTASEQNSDYFQIERSRDGINWTPVSKVQGMGNSNTTKNYQFYDMSSGSNFEGYYRLKQVDFDGNFEYFNPKYILCGSNKTNYDIEVFPNPVKEELFAGIRNSIFGDGLVTITDFSGKVVKREKVNLSDGYNLINIDVKDLLSGIYLIKIISNDEQFVGRFIKN